MSISRILTLLAGAVLGAVVLRKQSPAADSATWRPRLEELNNRFTEHIAATDARFADLQQAIQALAAGAGVRPDARVDELAARLAELQPRLEVVAAGLTAKPDARLDSLNTKLAELQPRIEAIAAQLKPDTRIDELGARFAALQPRLDGLAARLTAVEAKAEAAPWTAPVAELQGNVAVLQQMVAAHEQRLNATDHVLAAIEQVLNSKMAEFDQRVESQSRSLQALNSSIAQSDELIERVLDLVNNASGGESTGNTATACMSGSFHDLEM